MSMTIFCTGCGARLAIPDDYARNKMRCPECGVMCPVPPRPVAEKKAGERPSADEAAAFDDEEPVPPVRSAPQPPVTTFLKKPVGKGLATCPHCGETVRAPAGKRGRGGKCPVCSAEWLATAKAPKPVAAPVLVPPPPDEFAGSTPDEDPDSGNPYRTADGASRRCPGCNLWLTPDVVLCVRCGFDLRSGLKLVKEYQPIVRSWDSGLPLWTRLRLFLICQAIALTAMATGFLTLNDSPSADATAFVFSWFVYTAMTGFMLGTFDHFELKRHRSGRVDLVGTWRIAFFPRPPKKIDVRDYSGVVNGATAHAGFWEWVVFLILMVGGVVPAVLYYFLVIHKNEYTVALAKDYTIPEVYVFRGTSQEDMLEILQTLRDAMTV